MAKGLTVRKISDLDTGRQGEHLPVLPLDSIFLVYTNLEVRICPGKSRALSLLTGGRPRAPSLSPSHWAGAAGAVPGAGAGLPALPSSNEQCVCRSRHFWLPPAHTLARPGPAAWRRICSWSQINGEQVSPPALGARSTPECLLGSCQEQGCARCGGGWSKLPQGHPGLMSPL